MRIDVRYFSKGGGTKKLADAIAEAVGAEAKTVDVPLEKYADIVFLGASVYAGKPDPSVLSFISANAKNIGKIVVFGSACTSKSTYPQYVTMMVLWEKPTVTSKEIGERLHLDSGTLTPVIKKLAEKGLVTRARSPEDERNLVVTLTDAGLALRDRAACIPGQMGQCICLSPEDAATLYRILYQLLGSL